MNWFTRFSLSFLVAMFTQSMSALGQASPWTNFDNANAFVQSFLGSVSISGVFTQDQLDDMNSIGETIVRAMSDLGGNKSHKGLQALNTAFASAVAEIAMSDTGGQNVEETTDAIANALNLAFYQTTGKSNDAFVNEMYSLINTFAEASANAIVDEPAPSMSASAKTLATTSPQRTPQTATNAPGRAERTEIGASASAAAVAPAAPLIPNRSAKSPESSEGNDHENKRPAVAKLLANAEAVVNSKRKTEPKKYVPDIVQAADPSAIPTYPGPSGHKPSDNSPREAEPREALAVASATAAAREYKPEETEIPERVPVAGPTPKPTYSGPRGYKPSDNEKREAEPRETLAAASATAARREYSPEENEIPDRVPAAGPTPRPTDSGPRRYKPSDNGPREIEPTEALAAASATAAGREYSPERNGIPDRAPAAEPTDSGPRKYKPIDNGPRKAELRESLATASATAEAREYSPEGNDVPDRVSAAESIISGPRGYKHSDKGPREAEPRETLAAASATAEAREYRLKGYEIPDRFPAAEPTDSGPRGYKRSDNGPREAEPRETLAAASATAVAREYSPDENEIPDRVPAAGPIARPTDFGSRRYEPSDNGPREAVPRAVLTAASTTAAVREYSPEGNEVPDRASAAGLAARSTDSGPIEYKPSDNRPREAKPREVLAATSTTAAAAREYSPEENEIPDRVPAAGPTPRSTDSYLRGYKPTYNDQRETEPRETLVAASATAAVSEYSPEKNGIPDRVPAAGLTPRPTDSGPTGYKPSDNGPRKAEPRKALVAASAKAAVSEYSPEKNGIPDRVPAAGPTPRPTDSGPTGYKPSDNDPREAEPRKALVAASATAAAREYSPERNGIPDRVPAAGATYSGPRRYKPIYNGAREAESKEALATASAKAEAREYSPEGNDIPDRVPPEGPTDSGPSRYKTIDNGPREAKPKDALATASATAEAREYSPEGNDIPDRNPTAGPTDSGSRRYKPIDYGPREAEPKEALATAEAREYSPEVNDIPDRVPPAGPTDSDPSRYKPIDNGPREAEPKEVLASASSTAEAREYSPEGNDIPDRVPAAGPTDSGPRRYESIDNGPREAEPKEVLATASTKAEAREYSPGGNDIPDRVSATGPTDSGPRGYKPIDNGPREAEPKEALAAVSATAEAREYTPEGNGIPNRVPAAGPTDSGPMGYAPSDNGPKEAEHTAAASAKAEGRIRPISYKPSANIASSALAAASALSLSASGRRISSVASNLISGRPDNVANISRTLASVISQVSAANTSASDCDVLVQALFEIITALIHLLKSARIVNINYDSSETALMIAQSINEIFG